MSKGKSKRMTKELESTNKKTPLPGDAELNNSMTKPINDGMNTPVADHTPTPIPSESEVALFKQANNPLGNPNKK